METDVAFHMVKMTLVNYHKEEIITETILVKVMTDAQEEEITMVTTEEDSVEEERPVLIGKKDLVVTVIVADSYTQNLMEAEVVAAQMMTEEITTEEVDTTTTEVVVEDTTIEETITVVAVDTEVTTTEETPEIVSASNSKKPVTVTMEKTADSLTKNNLKSKELLKENQEVNASNFNKKVNALTVKTVNSHMKQKQMKILIKRTKKLLNKLLRMLKVMMND